MRTGFGFLGGSFDPVHHGHLAIASGAYAALQLQRVEFVLAPQPWQKAIATPVQRRLEMLNAAIEKHPEFAANCIELDRMGPTYTIDTVRALREHFGAHTPLIWILGSDQWKNLHTWKSWADLLDYVHLALCNRSETIDSTELLDSASDEVKAALIQRWIAPECITNHAAGHITTFSIPAHPASSTKIRELFMASPRNEAFRSLETWLPLPVARIIAQHHLYTHKL